MHPIKASSQPINELEQIVVDIPNRYHGMDQIIIVRDADTGLQVIGESELNLPIHRYGSAAAAMCSYRAALTVRGHVLLRGAKVRPEDYLKSWRSIVPTTPSELAARHGVCLFANLALDLAAEREKAWAGYREDISKLASLNEFLAVYPVDAQGNGTMRLDSRLAFADLTTFCANRARESGGNYEPKSRITIVAQQVTVVEKQTTVPAQAYQQAELI